jgi:two-component sensor histidine kinase/PAS domain-containing protein
MVDGVLLSAIDLSTGIISVVPPRLRDAIETTVQTASSWTRPGWRLLGVENQMNNVVRDCENLTQEDIDFLERLKDDLGILADLSRADVLMYCPLTTGQAVIVAQASPHSILPIYSESVVERRVSYADEPDVIRALTEGRRGLAEIRRQTGNRRSPAQGAPIVQETHPIQISDGRVIAAVSIETNLIERERHRRRSRVFRRALHQFQQMILAGTLHGAGQLTPFAEHDGVLVLDAQHRIQYVSGIATSLYRKLGYVGNLLKRRIEDLESDDSGPALEALETGECVEREIKLHGLIWVKKAIPLFSSNHRLRNILPARGAAPRVEGVLVTIHDETDARRQQEELLVKVAMIQEIHHRVKNNLQTIASLLRLQSRRAETGAVRRALQEGINRILSVAVIHEFLAHQDARVINIRDVSLRIINQTREGVLDRERGIHLDLRGPNIYLPTQPATVCALVINELLQNALEHGYERQEGGTVTVNLRDDGEQITISVDDDGVGLPQEFDLARTSSLGLQIVSRLAEGDLKGNFELRSRDKGVSAVVTFPKHVQGGR